MADFNRSLTRKPSEPTTENERWLRTTEAWDAFTNVLLERLEKADPGNGHGIGRCLVEVKS